MSASRVSHPPPPDNRSSSNGVKRKLNAEVCQFRKFSRMTSFRIAVDRSLHLDTARGHVHVNLHRCGQWRRTAVNTIRTLGYACESSAESVSHAFALMDRFLGISIERTMNSYNPSIVNFPIQSETTKQAKEIAMACFLLATKMRDKCAPCIHDFGPVLGLGWCTPEHIRASEIEVLTTLDWDLDGCTGNCTLTESTTYSSQLRADLSCFPPIFY